MIQPLLPVFQMEVGIALRTGIGKFFRVQNCAEMIKNCDCRSAQICDPARKIRRKKFYDFCTELQENKVL
jgi:hypothetical protein